MATTDIKQSYKDASSKINSYKTTIATQANEKTLQKLSLGDNFEMSKSEATKQLNAMGDKKQRLQSEIKNQFDELIDLVKPRYPQIPHQILRQLIFYLNKS